MNENHISVINDASELRKLILEYPDLPIVVLADAEICCDCSGYWYASRVFAEKGRICDAEVPWIDEKVYSDEGEFREDLEEWMYEEYTEGDCEPDDAYFQRMVEKQMEVYEPFWKECIIVRGTN